MNRRQKETLKQLARRMQVRENAERAADSARLVIDSISDPIYQPVGELGRRYASADRAAGTASRWDAMAPVLDELGPATAADIGCNAAWFTLQLGRRGIATVGVEGHPPYYRTAITAVRRSGLHNVGIMAIELTPETLQLVPRVDCLLFLSVWHHVADALGLEGASSFTRTLWEHTNKVMFFETGEHPEFVDSDYKIPYMGEDPKAWLSDYLHDVCEGSELVHLGTHPSGPDSPARRNLFAVKRTSLPG